MVHGAFIPAERLRGCNRTRLTRRTAVAHLRHCAIVLRHTQHSLRGASPMSDRLPVVDPDARHRRRRPRPLDRLAPRPAGRAGARRRQDRRRRRRLRHRLRVVRNNYFQPAMQELMAACVEVWESEPETLHYHPSGYIALGPERPGGRPDRGLRAPAADRLSVASCTSATTRCSGTCARSTTTGALRG